MTTLLLGTAGFTILGLGIAVALLWDTAQMRRIERDEAREERDTAVWEVSRLCAQQADDDTVPLPLWKDFLDPQAAHDQAVVEAMEQQFGEGR